MKNILEILKSRSAKLEKHCDEFELSIEEPVSETVVRRVEKELKRTFPPALKRFFLECSPNINVKWGLKQDVIHALPEELREVEFGSFIVNLDEFPAILANWSVWEDTSLDYDFENLFPLLEVPNGDIIVMVERGKGKGKIIYLDHESEEYYYLGSSLHEFLTDWVSLGCPGPEWWLLGPFHDPNREKLSLALETSKKWLEMLF